VEIVAGRCVEWRARMQWYAGEDPATGSAAGPCIAWLVKNGLVGSGESATIAQGVEMLRPSRLTVHATLQGETVREIRVAGRTIPVAEGRLFLP
jgi:trans-2,3-dihydro-3-hydroxyanthranilate isomerase